MDKAGVAIYVAAVESSAVFTSPAERYPSDIAQH